MTYMISSTLRIRKPCRDSSCCRASQYE